MLYFLLVVFPYIAAAIFLVGIIYRVYQWAKVPVPLRIPTTPAPRTYIGVWIRMFMEIFFFRNLFKGGKYIWVLAMGFHISFGLILIRHLRYFLFPVPEWVESMQNAGTWAGIIFVAVLIALFMRRAAIDRHLYVSSLADFFILLLLGGIALTGLLMRYFARTDILEIKNFMLHLLTFQPVSPPEHLVFVLHFIFISVLLIYFPMSKLMHMLGILFSPTINQRDTNRDWKHVNPWDPEGDERRSRYVLND